MYTKDNAKQCLRRVVHPRFIAKLIYATRNNAFYKDMYSDFGLKDCLVRPELYDAMMTAVPRLEKLRLKLVVFDAWRPWVVQKYMHDNAPEYMRPFIAPPPQPDSPRGFHPRAAALDCGLAQEDGTLLPFPTEPDAFYFGYESDGKYSDYLKRAHRSYNGADVSKEQYENRRLLENLMTEAGLEPLPTEWWHFSLPNAAQYPILYSLDDVEII